MSLKSIGALALLGAFAALGPTAAMADAKCGNRDQVVKRLAKSYGETRQSIGLGTENSLVEVYASDKTGTWSITVTRPDGTTCLIASGQSYEDLAGDPMRVLDEDV